MPPTAATPLSIATLKKTYGIGLTGGIATGKSTVAQILRKHGYNVIDADQLSRAVVAPGSEGLKALTAAFGPQILGDDGHLQRRLLGQLVFSDAKAKAQLDALLHPRIAALLAQRLEEMQLLTSPKIFFYEAALLVETGHASQFREYWCTTCSPATQLQRLIARDGRSAVEAQQIIDAQLPLATKAAGASIIIATDGSFAEIERTVEKALATLPPL